MRASPVTTTPPTAAKRKTSPWPSTSSTCRAAKSAPSYRRPLTGAAVAVTDKLDTLVGIFRHRHAPTGSKGPHALRRAALGVLRILIEKQPRPGPGSRGQPAVEQYGDKVKAAGLAEQALDLRVRPPRARYEDEGVDAAVNQSVRARSFKLAAGLTSASRPSRPSASCLKPRPWPRRTNGVEYSRKVRGTRFRQRGCQPAGGSRRGPGQRRGEQPRRSRAPLAAARDLSVLVTRPGGLCATEDTFFADVMVNVDEAAVRANQLACAAAGCCARVVPGGGISAARASPA